MGYERLVGRRVGDGRTGSGAAGSAFPRRGGQRRPDRVGERRSGRPRGPDVRDRIRRLRRSAGARLRAPGDHDALQRRLGGGPDRGQPAPPHRHPMQTPGSAGGPLGGSAGGRRGTHAGLRAHHGGVQSGVHSSRPTTGRTARLPTCRRIATALPAFGDPRMCAQRSARSAQRRQGVGESTGAGPAPHRARKSTDG